MSGYYNVPSETNESVFLTYTDWIGYVKDDSTFGYLLKNGVIQAGDWSTMTGKPTTYAPIIGTTSTTAKAGDWMPTWGEINSLIPAEATFRPLLGTSAVTAKPGNWMPSFWDIPDRPMLYLPMTGTEPQYAKPGNWMPKWHEVVDKPAISAKPTAVDALGIPSGVTVDDVQELYDKVNELLAALKA